MSSPTLDAAALEALVGRRIIVSGHFVGTVTLDGVEDLGDAVSLRVRTSDGSLHETVLDREELGAGAVEQADEGVRLVDGNELFDLIESKRIELAYAHDPNFAVSMSGVRGLPHQIIAVYRHMLPQPRLAVRPRRRSWRRQDDHGRPAAQGAAAANGRRPRPDPVPRAADRPVAGRAVRQVRRALHAGRLPPGEVAARARPHGWSTIAASPRSTSPNATRCSPICCAPTGIW